MTEQSLQQHRDECVQAAARVVNEAAFRLIESDPHSWSTRPCQTCRAVTAIIGRPFGCARLWPENRRSAQPQPAKQEEP